MRSYGFNLNHKIGLILRDLDDALSVEELPGNMYKVGVHIADVSYFVGEGTTIDEIAQRRATSVYLVQEVRTLLTLSPLLQSNTVVLTFIYAVQPETFHRAQIDS